MNPIALPLNKKKSNLCLNFTEVAHVYSEENRNNNVIYSSTFVASVVELWDD